jgi:hypothetical protein
MKRIEEMLISREIEQQIIRFARAMDAREWHILHEILADDAVANGTVKASAPGWRM